MCTATQIIVLKRNNHVFRIYVILNLTDSHTYLVVGNFGEVHVGLLLDADNAAKSQPVAIKTIRGKGHSDNS